MSDVEAFIRSAYELHRLDRRDEALTCVERAVAAFSSDPRTFNLRGMILESMGRHAEARLDIERALQIKPDFADAINNLGIAYSRDGHFEAALACYERSLEIAPEQAQTRYNCAMARLALGDWQRGFREFECRWQLFPHEAVRFKQLAPVWLGQWEVAGRTVLLHHEQGYGDTLQFARYVPLVMALGARVILAVPKALRALMTTLSGQPEIVSEGEPVPRHDYCCSLMSLPMVFGTSPDNVPASIPYLRADLRAAHVWREKLGAASRLRIGLVWSGRRYPPINFPRDIPLEALQPLLTLGADFVSLQQELTDSERAVLAAYPNVACHGDGLGNFADTAALVHNLDLVITVDTAVAHLAGALGKPVWLMNRYASCWRWLQKRPDTPWYPNVRLFRQNSLGDWSGVVRAIHEAAEALIAQEARRREVTAVQDESLTHLQNGLAAHRCGNLGVAIAAYARVLSVHPTQPDALHLRGIALAQQGRHAEALESLSLALRFQPDNAAAHNHHGNALTGLSRHAEALASYDRAIELNEPFADAHYNRGAALVELGRSEAAISSYQRAIELNPSCARACNNLGNVWSNLERHSDALQCYEQATRLQPDFTDAWTNRANLLRRLLRYEEALASSEQALRCDPDNAEAHGSRGTVLACLGRYEEALACYRRATDLNPMLADAIWNRAIAHLSRGEFAEGWIDYEARWKVKSLGLSQRVGLQPPWRGTQLRGKTILLHAEQGYGDTIQFCRYAPLVAARGGRVLLGVPSALQALMSTLDGVAQVISQGTLPAFDEHCPLLSLPLAFGTDLATIPAPACYLRADSEARARWRARLGGADMPRVGLAWSGRGTHTNDSNRSIALEQLLPLTRCGIQCVSLQKEVRTGDQAVLAHIPSIRRFGEDLQDFADTAALVSELDLVITVDTAVAHLAGALGKPVWILLPHVADWRWMQAREDSPWYPSATLLRQSSPKDWAGVIERVQAKLCAREFVLQRPHFVAQTGQPSPYFSR